MLQKMTAFLHTPILFVFLLVCCCWMATTASKKSSSECEEKCKTYSLQTNGTKNSSEEEGDRARRRRKRIINGLEGDIEQMPWLVFLSTSYQSNNQTQLFNCTGSLISARHVLTNAHCLRVNRMLDTDTTTVVYGSANKLEGHQIVVSKNGLHLHPNYTAYFANGNGFSVYDLAIVDLGQDVEFDETVNSICTVCLEEATPTQGPAIIAGWGSYSGLCLGQPSEYPLVFLYDIVSMHACKTPDYTKNNMVCTYADYNKGINGGDSGGPVLGSRHNNTDNDDGRRFYQLGVTGANNCQTTPFDQRENAFTKIDGEWMEQISGVRCKKYLDDN